MMNRVDDSNQSVDEHTDHFSMEGRVVNDNIKLPYFDLLGSG